MCKGIRGKGAEGCRDCGECAWGMPIAQPREQTPLSYPQSQCKASRLNTNDRISVCDGTRDPGSDRLSGLVSGRGRRPASEGIKRFIARGIRESERNYEKKLAADSLFCNSTLVRTIISASGILSRSRVSLITESHNITDPSLCFFPAHAFTLSDPMAVNGPDDANFLCSLCSLD